MDAYEAIVACDGDRDRAAELLGISKRTLYRLLTAEDKRKLIGDGLTRPSLTGVMSKAASWIRVHGHPKHRASGWKELSRHLYGATDRATMQKTYMVAQKLSKMKPTDDLTHMVIEAIKEGFDRW